jgi:hypothetical protein
MSDNPSIIIEKEVGSEIAPKVQQNASDSITQGKKLFTP